MESREETVELEEMEQHLQQDGMSAEVSMTERLRYLWKLFLRSESTLGSVTRELKTTRTERIAEMDQLEKYLEHIRSLSKQRDSAALELEQDNDMLRAQLKQMSLQQEAMTNEVAEMLYQEGLAEVIPSSPSEQVAYLLAERATLLERLQGPEATKSETHTPPGCPQERESTPLSPRDSIDKEAPSRGQSPWKRLLGLRKAAQSKHTFSAFPQAVGTQASEESVEREKERQCLERDMEEASRRLAMAHKEIRRLTDELESAHMTQSAYEPELQGAQQEVEQLRQEVEKMKRCEVAELRRAKEHNERLDLEIRVLRNRVRSMDSERMALRDMGDGPDSPQQRSFSSKARPTAKYQENIHDRCREELEELQLCLQRQQEECVELRRKKEEVQEECEELRTRREEAEEECGELMVRREEVEELLRKAQCVNVHQRESHRSVIQQLEIKMKGLQAEIHELSIEPNGDYDDRGIHLQQLVSLEGEVSRLQSALQEEQQCARQQQTALQAHLDQAKALAVSQESVHQQKGDECRQQSEELQRTHGLLRHAQQELHCQRERNLHLEGHIAQLEQEKDKVSAEQQQVQAQAREGQLGQSAAAQDAALQASQQRIRELEQQLELEKEVHTAKRAQLEEDTRDMAGNLSILSAQVQEDQLQRSLWGQRETELQQQVWSLREREAQLSRSTMELSLRAQGLETQLEVLQSEGRGAREELRQSTCQDLEERLMSSQQDSERLQTQLKQVMLNLDTQISKYTEKQSRNKAKLGRAKQVFVKETLWRDERIQELERDFGLLTRSSQKDRDLIRTILDQNDKLLLQNNNLQMRMCEEEERRKNSECSFSATQQRVDFLEKENGQLQDIRLVMSNQIAVLERAVQNKQSVCSIEECKKMFPFENLIMRNPLRGTDSSVFPDGCEMRGLLDIIQRLKTNRTEELSSPLSLPHTRTSEIGYLNLTSPKTPADPQADQ